MSDQHDETKPTWTTPEPGVAAPTKPPTTSIGTTPVTPVTTTPVTPVAAPPRRRSGAWVNVLLGVAVVIAIGGVAFAIGRTTAPASAATVPGFQNGNGGPGVGGFVPGGSFDPGALAGGGRGVFGGGGITIDGTVQSMDGSSMVIALASGDTVTVQLDATTRYHQSTPASATDVAVGDDVAVQVAGGFGGGALGGGGFGNGNGPGNGNGNGGAPGFTASDVTVTQ